VSKVAGFLLVLATTFTFAQEVQVEGKFQSDSLMIGQPFSFSVRATYPKHLQILFPDSTFAFKPFEFESKEYFTTKTTGEISRDSVVYRLTSYEIDSVQVFQIPVFVVQPADCTEVWSRPDSIFLKHFVAAVPDTVEARQLPLKTNTEYLPVSWILNYPVILFVAGGLAVAVILVWLIFGNRIRRYYRVKRLNRNHYTFMERFEHAVQQVQSNFTSPRAEDALVIWKKYMEGLEGKPYTKFTSREIASMVTDEQLASALKGIDRMIYGGRAPESPRPFTDLQQFSQAHFAKKLEEVSHE
jgi:hypothetical protein